MSFLIAMLTDCVDGVAGVILAAVSASEATIGFGRDGAGLGLGDGFIAFVGV